MHRCVGYAATDIAGRSVPSANSAVGFRQEDSAQLAWAVNPTDGLRCDALPLALASRLPPSAANGRQGELPGVALVACQSLSPTAQGGGSRSPTVNLLRSGEQSLRFNGSSDSSARNVAPFELLTRAGRGLRLRVRLRLRLRGKIPRLRSSLQSLQSLQP